MRVTGRYEVTSVLGESVRAFVPTALPPKEPALTLAGDLVERVAKAEEALRMLNLAAAMVPDVDWFVYAFVRKEAVVTSQIEGTQATLVDLLTFEAEQPPGLVGGVDRALQPDVEEVCNYLDAMTWARKQLSSAKGVPISVRLFNEAHKRLMKGVRGADQAPGELRRTQNWIGGRWAQQPTVRRFSSGMHGGPALAALRLHRRFALRALRCCGSLRFRGPGMRRPVRGPPRCDSGRLDVRRRRGCLWG